LKVVMATARAKSKGIETLQAAARAVAWLALTQKPTQPELDRHRAALASVWPSSSPPKQPGDRSSNLVDGGRSASNIRSN
jgi:hypothetical protein